MSISDLDCHFNFNVEIKQTLSTFPHGTCTLSVNLNILGIEGGPPIIPTI